MVVLNLAATLAAAFTVLGCSGLDARRVPLEERLSGTDKHYHGFRYYLSRPYLVVSERVDIVTTQQLARIVHLERKFASPAGEQTVVEYVLETINEQGKSEYFSMTGQPIDVPEDVRRTADVLSFEAAVSFFSTQVLDQSFSTLDQKPPPSGQPATPPKPVETTKPPPTSSGAPQTSSLQDLTLKNPPGGPAAPAAVVKQDGKPVDKLQLVFLPDFEEQMAVDHTTILAKSKISMAFRDGWQLKSVSGNFDNTDVPVRILQTIKNAISAAGAVENKRLQLAGSAADASGTGGGPGSKDQTVRTRSIGLYVSISRTLYIEPGIYRLNKPQEQQGEVSHGAGLLTDLGLTPLEETKVQLKMKN
jgi:hypothetical protein